MRIVEVCAGDIQSAQAAAQGGAQRIELCAALELDGLTPSAGLIEAARALPNLKLHVLIRPREGNFVYDANEVEIMYNDILLAKRLGADGVVIGALTWDGDIDVNTCRHLIEAAEGMQVTFHRAFDQCNDPQKALEEIISLGCTRILTSGQKATAEAGIPLLKQLVDQANGRIIIMPGAGVNTENAWRILHETGATEIHGSFRSDQKGRMITDANIVNEVVESINDMN
jgi:copper homeostasis protein